MKGCPRALFADMTIIENKLHSLSPPLYALHVREDKEMAAENDFIEAENASNGYLNGHSSDEGLAENSGCKSPDSDVDVVGCGKAKDVLSRGGLGEKKIYRCTHCKYVTDRKNNLKRHVVTMHDTCTKTLECCDVIFQNKASLRDHVMSCHKNGYDCRICGRTFCRKALLKRHITVHSGQKDYICNVCGYATSHKSNLDRHKRRHGPKFIGDDHQSLESLSPPPPPPPPLPPPPAQSSALSSSSSSSSLDMSKYLPPEFASCAALPAGVLQIPYPNELVEPCYRSSSHHRNRMRSGRYIFTNRLLCTHERGAKSAKTHEGKRGKRANDDVNSNTLHETKDIENVQNETRNALQRNNNHNLLLPPKKAYSTRRLFPTLYKCKDCEVVFENQLQLNVHVTDKHLTENEAEVPAPQRPLTLQVKQQQHRTWY